MSGGLRFTLRRLLCASALLAWGGVSLSVSWGSVALAQEVVSPKQIEIALPSGQVIRAEVAEQMDERRKGLMGRHALADGGGMLFVLDSPGEHVFWMQNMRFPLDIVYLDDEGVVQAVFEHVPCEPDSNGVPASVRGHGAYVLELNAGTSRLHGLEVGERLVFAL